MKKTVHRLLISLLAIPLVVPISSCQGVLVSESGSSSADSASSSQDSGSEDSEDVIHEVVALAITTPPTKITYFPGETFDPSGMVVEATWEDGIKQTVTKNQYSVDPSGALAATTTKITVSFGGQSAALAISVINSDGIGVITSATKNIYEIGDVFDPTGLTIGLYAEGGSFSQIEGWTFDGKALAAADTHVEISFGGKTLDYPITVISASNLKGLDVIQPANKTTYVEGDVFDPSGIIIVAILDDNRQAVVTKYLQYDGKALSIADKSTAIAYLTVTYDYPISVVGKGMTIEFESQTLLPAAGSRMTTKATQNPTHWMLQYASGGDFICDINAGDQIKVSFGSDAAGTADLILRGASNRVDANPPTVVQPTQLNRVVDVTVNDAALTIGDDKVLAGKSTTNPSGDKWLWVNWVDVDLGDIALLKGTNVILFTFTNPDSYKQPYGDALGQYDCLTLSYK